MALNRSKYILLLLARAIPSGADSGKMIRRRRSSCRITWNKCNNLLRLDILGPVPERCNNSIPGINVPYPMDK